MQPYHTHPCLLSGSKYMLSLCIHRVVWTVVSNFDSHCTCSGNDPSVLKFRRREKRHHLWSCFQTKQMNEMFPTKHSLSVMAMRPLCFPSTETVEYRSLLVRWKNRSWWQLQPMVSPKLWKHPQQSVWAQSGQVEVF